MEVVTYLINDSKPPMAYNGDLDLEGWPPAAGGQSRRRLEQAHSQRQQQRDCGRRHLPGLGWLKCEVHSCDARAREHAGGGTYTTYVYDTPRGGAVHIDRRWEHTKFST
jgi:hypothetical protein